MLFRLLIPYISLYAPKERIWGLKHFVYVLCICVCIGACAYTRVCLCAREGYMLA